METGRRIEWGVVGVVVLSLVVAGPVASGSEAQYPSTFGDGDATVSVDSFPADSLVVNSGQFGTDVYYLRIPDVVLTVEDVRDQPRLVYRVEIPELGVDESMTRVLSEGRPGSRRIRGIDRAFDGSELSESTYTATVSLRVQSFEVDRTITSTNTSVEVRR